MAMIDDGGQFSDDLITRLKAAKAGSMSADDLAQSEDIPNQGVQAGMNSAMGTLSGPKMSALQSLAGGAESAAPAELGMADRIKQAAANSNVKVIPSAFDNELAQYAEKAGSQPEFGQGNLPERNVPDQNMANYQGGLRDQAMQERNAQQLADRKNILQQKLQQMYGK